MEHSSKQLTIFNSGSAILTSCPHRIIYPHTEGFARLIAPLEHCKGAAHPFEFSPPSSELTQTVGSKREVFYHSSSGICYAGTFLGTGVGEISVAEYAKFEKPVRLPSCPALRLLITVFQTKEAILRHTFPLKVEFQKAHKVDCDRLRNWYMTGKAKVQYLELRYLGFNKPLFNAIMDLDLMNSDDPATVLGRRPSSAAGRDLGKRARM